MAYPTRGLSTLVYSRVAHATHLPYPRMAYHTIGLSMLVYSKVAHATHLPYPGMAYHTVCLSRLSYNIISHYIGRDTGGSKGIGIDRGISIGRGIRVPRPGHPSGLMFFKHCSHSKTSRAEDSKASTPAGWMKFQ